MSESKKWNARIQLLSEMVKWGKGWDGYDAGPPKPEVVPVALVLMEKLKATGVYACRLLIDEDADVCLTWGEVMADDYLVFLTIEESKLHILVMDGEDTIHSSDDIPYELDADIPIEIKSTLARNLYSLWNPPPEALRSKLPNLEWTPELINAAKANLKLRKHFKGKL